ncbi:hypothetical protein IC607_03195 [Cellulomonas sp. JH27-2]|uniref:protealysin inhibitor emfourin n=1 Tax=Cellulomonas sp. JH27-2 TaxID=2774139 RepID=UPI00177C6321|nr:protealysin inhibitor emfourin [Cellulomonas sp. JH27-2]MBD8057970.1 hypothetical protein [Cellulomonas sp. JH27-2]
MARRVVLETAGGVAAIFAARALVVDDDELDDHGRRRLSELVTAADDGSHADPGPGLLRDAQTYQITVEHPDGPSLVLSASDGHVSPPFAELRDWIRDHGRPAPSTRNTPGIESP